MVSKDVLWAVTKLSRVDGVSQDDNSISQWLNGIFRSSHRDQGWEADPAERLSGNLLTADGGVSSARFQEDNDDKEREAMAAAATQRIGMQVLHNLSCEEQKRQVIVDLGLRSVLSLVSRQRSPETRRWAAGMLCNLSLNPDHANLLVQEGAINAVKELIGASVEHTDECVPYFSQLFYHMAQSDAMSLKRMVQESADSLLVLFLCSSDPVVLEMSSIALYNISCNEDCQVVLADHQILAQASENKKPGLLQILMTMKIPTSKSPDLIVLLILATVYNLTCQAQNEVTVTNDGATRACAMLAESDSLPIVRVCSKILFNIATVPQNHKQMMADGIMQALATMIKHREVFEESLITLAHMSSSPEVSGQLLRENAIGMMCEILNTYDGDKPDVREKLAIVFRNLTCARECKAQIVATTELLPFLDKLIATTDQIVMTHVAMGLYNLLEEPAKYGIIRANDILTKIHRSSTDEETKKACGISLVACQPSSNEGGGRFNSGSVVALLSSVHAQEEKQEEMDHGIVRLGDAYSTPVKDFDCIQGALPPSIRCPAAVRSKNPPEQTDQANWTCFSHTLATISTNNMDILPVKGPFTCEPPRLNPTHSSGKFTKLLFDPVKVQLNYDADGQQTINAQATAMTMNVEVDHEALRESEE